MSAIWFVGLLISGTMAFDDMPILNDRMISTISPHNAPNSDSCVGQCAMIFVDEMNSQLGPGKSVGLLNLNYNEFLTAFSNATFFESFCRYVKTSIECLTFALKHIPEISILLQ